MKMLESTGPSRNLEASSTPRRPSAPNAELEALPDLLLIERARSGDPRAIEALIRRCSRRLYRVAWSVLLDEERSEAAVLEAYLAAFGDLSRYELTGKFAAWLTRLAHQQARALHGAARAPGAAAGGPEATTQAPDLERSIAALPEVFRTVYVLRMVEGVSGIETAASLGLHQTTVRTRLYRAHRRLAPETAQRVQATPGLLEPTAAGTDRIVSRTLGRLLQGSMLRSSASPP
jgi:RNA polymerase sigma-70 factor, ECF subfamily